MDIQVIKDERLVIFTMCRACMESITPPDACKPLFSDGIAEMFTTCTNIEIENSDGLPANVCLRCFQTLDMVHAFKELCIASDLKLKELLKTNNTFAKDPHLDTEFIDSEGIKLEDDYLREEHDSNAWNLPVKVLTGTSANKKSKLDNMFDCKFKSAVVDNVTLRIDRDYQEMENTCADVATSTDDTKVKFIRTLKSEKSSLTQSNTHKLEDVCMPFVCQVCGKSHKTKRNLKRHMVQHNKDRKHKCDVCDKSFMHSWTLVMHKKIHGAPQCVCDLCGKSFVQKITLTNHMRTHTSDRPFSCNICDLKCKTSVTLKAHEARHTLENKKVECTTCGSKFFNRSDLAHHIRTHTNLKPFLCLVCNKTYLTKYRLTVHTRTHTGLRPYLCDLCPESFTQPGVLKNHRRTHTGEKPFVCVVCQQAFRQRSVLTTHMKIHKRLQHNDNTSSSNIVP